MADALASGLASLQALFDPDRIVLAHGFADRVVRRLAALPATLRPSVVTASLGVEAGLVGVADHTQPTTEV